MGYFPGNHRSDFKLVFKKHLDANRGSRELLSKNLLYDVHKEKVWRS
jgi:hypothetical protein